MVKARNFNQKNIDIRYKELGLASAISFLISFLGIYIIPRLFSYITINSYKIKTPITAIGFFAVIGIILATILLVKEIGGASIGAAAKRTILIGIIFAIVILAVSLFSGLASEVIYSKNIGEKSLGEIKTIIDIVSKAVLVILSPLGIMLFWKIAEVGHLRSESSTNRFPPLIKRYLLLTIPIVIGMLIAMAFNLIQGGMVSVAVRIIYMTILGVVIFYISGLICRNREVKGSSAIMRTDLEGAKA